MEGFKRFLGRLIRRAVTVAGGGMMIEGSGATSAAGLALVLAELVARQFLEERERQKQQSPPKVGGTE